MRCHASVFFFIVVLVALGKEAGRLRPGYQSRPAFFVGKRRLLTTVYETVDVLRDVFRRYEMGMCGARGRTESYCETVALSYSFTKSQ